MKILAVEITNAECGDIAITAIEGGIGYWAQADSYDWKRWTEPDEYVGDMIDVADDFVFYTIHEDPFDDGTYRGDAIDITPTLIKRGVALALSGVEFTDEERASRRAWAEKALSDQDSINEYANEKWQCHPRQLESDLSEMDSAEADLVIQLGALGKLVYG